MYWPSDEDGRFLLETKDNFSSFDPDLFPFHHARDKFERKNQNSMNLNCPEDRLLKNPEGHLAHFLSFDYEQLYSISIVYDVLVLITISILLIFCQLILTHRIARDNRCFFSQNIAYLTFTNGMQLFYTCLFHHTPDVYASTRSNEFELYTISVVRWSTAAMVMLFTQFAFYVAAFAKIVSLTFKLRYQNEVWNEKVAAVGFFICLGFPILFVGSFMIENPRSFHIKQTYSCLTGETSALEDYNNLRVLICCMGCIATLLGLALALIKKFYVTRNIGIFRHFHPPVVRIMTSAAAESDELRRPHRVRLRNMDVHYGTILFIYGLIVLVENLYIENGFPYYSPYELFLNLFRVASLPLLTLLYKLVPMIAEGIHYLPWYSIRREKRNLRLSVDPQVLSIDTFVTSTPPASSQNLQEISIT